MEKKVADQKVAEEKGKNPTLPFVTNESYWEPEATKDIFLNEVIGDLYALDYLYLLRRGGVDSLKCSLSQIVGGMVHAGRYGATEISFISTLDQVIRSYGVPQMNVDQYRFWKRSNILGIMEEKGIPKTTKLKVIEYLTKVKRQR